MLENDQKYRGMNKLVPLKFHCSLTFFKDFPESKVNSLTLKKFFSPDHILKSKIEITNKI